MRRRVLVTVLTAGLLAAGCAAGPIGSSAPPAAPPSASSSAPPSAPPASSSVLSSALSSALQGDASLVAVQTCTVPTRFKRVEVSRLPGKAKVVALTFDAGANADGVRSILDTLAARRVTATFFLTGDFVKAFPNRSTRIARRYVVGNHTMTHRDLTTISDLAVTRQVRRAERAIRDTTGQDPQRFFRFPSGARNAHTIRVVNRLCYVPFGWTVDTLGWTGTEEGGMTVGRVVARVVAGARPGAIVLMHVGSNPDDHSTLDADALPRVIRALRVRGYSFVSLSRVMSPAP